MHKPRLLDLFCGAGGAGMGYSLAGFKVVGLDMTTQKNYPFEFHRIDVMKLMGWVGFLSGFDVIHASPPCQGYSVMSGCREGLADSYPKLIEPVRQMLSLSGKPYVIENVPGSPVRPDLILCGTMFGQELYRHRLFESNVKLVAPEHPKHVMPTSRAGHWTPGTVMSVAGNIAPMAHARRIMQMDWTTRAELVEAIPPYYTEYIGTQLRKELSCND